MKETISEIKKSIEKTQESERAPLYAVLIQAIAMDKQFKFTGGK